MMDRGVRPVWQERQAALARTSRWYWAAVLVISPFILIGWVAGIGAYLRRVRIRSSP